MPLRRILFWIVFSTIGLIISYFILFSYLWRCMTIQYSTDFKSIRQKFYVSATTSPLQTAHAIHFVEQAQIRIEKFWGGRVGNPTIILCQTTQQYQLYCNSNEGAGCSLGTPWGASYIVLNLDGLNTDVIAHEMCHDELFNRLGWWKTARQIPQWFNEGLALMVDYRFIPQTTPQQRAKDYADEIEYASGGGQIALTLKDIATMKGFFGGDNRHVMLAYITSGAEVARWLAIVGDENISVFIERISQGEDFNTAYEAMQKKPISPDTKSAK